MSIDWWLSILSSFFLILPFMKVIFMVDLICSDELFQYHTLRKKKGRSNRCWLKVNISMQFYHTTLPFKLINSFGISFKPVGIYIYIYRNACWQWTVSKPGHVQLLLSVWNCIHVCHLYTNEVLRVV